MRRPHILSFSGFNGKIELKRKGEVVYPREEKFIKFDHKKMKCKYCPSLFKTVQARAQHEIWTHRNEYRSEKEIEETKGPSVIEFFVCGNTSISPEIIEIDLS